MDQKQKSGVLFNGSANTWLAGITMAIIVTAGLFFHTRLNNFPVLYYPVEIVKATQVIKDKPNFRHPALILTVTRLVAGLRTGFDLKNQYQIIGQTGRAMNAIYAGIALLAFMWLLFQYHGVWAVPVFGVTAVLSHTLLNETHIFKEEPAFLMGVSLVLLAAYSLNRKPERNTLIGLAIACGIAVSCKWPAVIIVGLAFWLLWLNRQKLPVELPILGICLKPMWAFLIISCSVFMLFNYQLLFRFKHLFGGMFHELNQVAHGYGGLVYLNPAQTYLGYFQHNLPPLFQVLAGLYLAWFLLTLRRRSLHECLEVAFLAIFAAILFSAKYTSERYFLNVEILLIYLGTKFLMQGLNFLDTFAPPNKKALLRASLAALVMGCVLWTQWPDYAEHLAAYNNDSRKALLDWINTHLPSASLIVADARTSLPDQNFDLYRKAALKNGWVRPLLVKRLSDSHKAFASDFGSVASLKHGGVTHVAIVDSYYNVLENPQVRYMSTFQDEMAKKHHFYQDLKSQGQLVWHSPVRNSVHLTALELPVSLYRI